MMKIWTSALIGAVFLLSCITPPTERESFVTVEGRGSLLVEPDRVDMSISLSETAPTTGEARDVVNRKVNRVLNILSDWGVTKENIRTTRLVYRAKTRWDGGEEILLGQTAEQRLSFSFSLGGSVDTNRLIDALTGVEGIGIDRLNFSLSERKVWEAKAREMAFDAAREKAEHYARLSGLRLGRVVYLSPVGRSPSPVGGVMMAEAKSFDSGTSVQPGREDVEIVLSVQFAME